MGRAMVVFLMFVAYLAVAYEKEVLAIEIDFSTSFNYLYASFFSYGFVERAHIRDFGKHNGSRFEKRYRFIKFC
jgi:hypothetical protein